ncbi:MAG: hypothetical protein JWQ43_3804 [Glaciihabitans sp.]|nr:hypothetical protein [Glaciihabitans sp.]
MPAKHRLPVPASSRVPTPVRTSTRVRDQPALTTSSGRIWLVLGGILAIVAVALLVPMLGMAPAGTALVSIILIVALYVGMLLSSLVRPAKRRLTLMAWSMIGIAGVALVGIGMIAAAQWETVA